MTDTAPASLFARLHAAQREIGGIKPDGENKHHSYRYVKAETLISEVGYMLRLHGLTLVASSFTVTSTGLTVEDKNGKALPVIKCSRVLKLVCHETGEVEQHEIDWFVSPDAGRPIDKACGVASTAALGYFLRDLLLIPRTDGDPNDDEWDRRREEAERKASKPREPEVTDDQRDEVKALGKQLKMSVPDLLAFCGGNWPHTSAEADRVIGKLRDKRDAAMTAAVHQVKPEPAKEEAAPAPLKPTTGELLLDFKAAIDKADNSGELGHIWDEWQTKLKGSLRAPQYGTATAYANARGMRFAGKTPVKGSPEEAAETVLAAMGKKTAPL